MTNRPASRPANERRLFADICGALASLGAALGALLVSEAVDRAIVPLGWLGYFILWLVVWIAIIGVAAKCFRGAYNRYLELADAQFPTPMVLQRGYGWILEKLQESSLLGFAVFGVSVGAFMSATRAVLRSSGADQAMDVAGPFLTIVLILCAAIAICIAIFVIASLLAGLVLGRSKVNSDSS